MKIVEILVAFNALAGIAVFFGARTAIRKLVRKMHIPPRSEGEPDKQE